MLSDGIVALRALENDDIDLLYIWENDPELWSVGITLAPYSRGQIQDYVTNYDADIFTARQLRLMIVEVASGCTIGTADLFDFDPVNSRSGIGIMVAQPYQRRGYALRALSIIENYCRSRLSLHQLYCVVGADNLPSRELFSKAGYKISGRLKSWLKAGGKFTDTYLMQRFLQDSRSKDD